VLERYVDGRLDRAAQASVETHLSACSGCQRLVADTSPVDTDALWSRVVVEVESPDIPVLVRLLQKAGLRETDGVVLSVSSPLHLTWVLAFVVTLGFTLAAALLGGESGRLVFVTIAPLVPVLGVVWAFDSTDPLRGLMATTPYSKFRLSLLRTWVVCVAAVPTTIGLGLLLPGSGRIAVAWLGPALALTTIGLLLLSWWDARHTAAALVIAWLTVIVLLRMRDQADLAVQAPLQVVYAAVTLAAVALLLVRLTQSRVPGGYA
jgi:hypothetical protein